MMDILPVVLYVLGSILLIVLIILGIKLIKTMNKVDQIVDDITGKVKSLDGFFSVVDFTTDKLAAFSSKLAELVSSFIKKLFKNKDEEEKIDE